MRSDAIHPNGSELDLVETPRLTGPGLSTVIPPHGSNSRHRSTFHAQTNTNIIGREVSYRARDLVLGGLFLILFAPLLGIIALLIRMDSAGPALFRQQRGGINGTAFTCLKFRTMTVQENGEDVRAAARDDQRVTRIGRFLRRTSLDELPQLINVVRGDMALVGPRPHALAHDRRYATSIPNYEQRFQVKPGITGLAQVLDLRGGADTDASINTRLAADLNYVKSRSIALDFVIILMTPLMLVFCRSAY